MQAATIVFCRNMNAVTVANRTVPLVQFFRQAHPSTPIVLAEGDPFGRWDIGYTQPGRRTVIREWFSFCRNWAVAAQEQEQLAANAALSAA
jgi:hypothetical protein